MNNEALLQPAVALLLLSTIMWFWMYATRIPAIQKMGLDVDPHLPNGQPLTLLPAKVRWKADNYNHLMEQPTMFYAVICILVLLGEVNQVNVYLAWAYVGLRTIHSVIQAVWNIIMLRFLVFSLASMMLFALIVRAVNALW